MTPQFHTPLDMRLAGRGRWRTLMPLIYQSALWAEPIIVAAELVTDLASVPRMPFAFMLTGGRAPGPAVVHDWLYQHPDWDDRELADAIFEEAMGVDQPELGFEAESAVIRKMMWAGVRAGGWHAWNKQEARAESLNPVWTTATGWPESP